MARMLPIPVNIVKQALPIAVFSGLSTRFELKIDRSSLHNFGVYIELQSIKLTPASLSKPVILFGGLKWWWQDYLRGWTSACFI
jgi:hypothetical protein